MRSLLLLLVLFLALAGLGCGHAYQPAPKRLALVQPGPAGDAYALLSTKRGPDRFSQVTPTLYRGGQPTAEQLRLLHDLGVRDIVTMVDEPDIVQAERTAAAGLGMTVHNFPFSGLTEPNPDLLRHIVGQLQTLPGPVYVHCRQGRDRTSLVVALYRVWAEGWNRDLAWRHEALDFGHGGVRAIFFRKLDRAYLRLTQPTPVTLPTQPTQSI